MSSFKFPATLRRIILWVLLVIIFATSAIVLALRWVDPATSAFILSSSGKGEVRGPVWSDWENISPWLPLAIIAAEDQKFPFHRGFDIESIRRAVRERIRRGRIRGASTISQQLAKNLFLWPQRSWLRKGLEVYFTLLLEAFLPKQRILELYMNLAEFGPSLFGAGMAARVYFSKNAKQLDLNEACLLAAVLPNPKQLHVHNPGKESKIKVKWIQTQINALGGRGYLDNL
jgi:monofunctional biosynthetic peptidoglycan transglycosylase